MFESKKVKVTKTTKVVEKPKEEERPKEPIQIYYSVKEDIEMATKQFLDTMFYNCYGLVELSKSLRTKRDAKSVAEKVGEHLSLLKANYIGNGETKPLGAFHANVEEIAITHSKTENKGIRATLVVNIENYRNDSKDSWYEFYNIYPCECLSDLVNDLADVMSDAVYDKVRHEASKYNEKLEKENNVCKCKKCKCHNA